ncbi:MAG: DNA recombination protein RmuC, partial [Spirochaetia bacterium]|nr:DNA recombination protein RmuC [Spirochaetia bacterium]
MIILLIVLTLIIGVISLVLILSLLKRDNGGDDHLIADRLVTYERNLKDEFAQNRKEMSEANRASRTDTTAALMAFQAAVNNKLDALTKSSQDSFIKQQESVTTGLSKVMEAVSFNLKHIQESNEKKLEEMRVTVDEKLQSTLEKRLTSSFELVTKQLEAVQKGLGEMQTLASDVGGLKRALTNVKTAGGMG